MTRLYSAGCIFGAIVIFLTGCEGGSIDWFSPEKKINSAFPVSETVVSSKSALLDGATAMQREYIATQLNLRMKLRALNCAKGYSPSWYVTRDSIRKVLGTTSCFAEADKVIQNWLGVLRVGLLLAKPSIETTPATSLTFLVSDAFIQTARFATNAPVAILETQQSILVYDVQSSKVLFQEPKSSSMLGPIALNGRLFVAGDGSGDILKIRDSQTGATVAELPAVRSFEFHWLDARTAIYNKRDTGKPFLLDFVTGTEAAVRGVDAGVVRAVRVPNADSQYILFTNAGISKVELKRDQNELSVELLADKKISAMGCGLNTADMTPDGKHFFCSSRAITVVSLETLGVENISFDPFFTQTGIATPDPDKILITGYLTPSQGEGSSDYLYSISTKMIAAVARPRELSRRFVNIPHLKKLGVISESKIEILGDVPVLESISSQKFAANAQELANQRKLNSFEKQIEGDKKVAGGDQINPRRLASGPMADLAKNAQIEAVGVYQGGGGSSIVNGRKMGVVEVRVRRSAKPIFLVLSAYEPVRWMVNIEPGAALAAVMVSGYYPSQVVGVGSVPVVMSGTGYAYKRESSEYQALNRDVANLTGKDIGLFQGKYDAAQFSVGGVPLW